MQDGFRWRGQRFLKHLESLPGKILGLLASAIVISTFLERIGHPLKSPYRWLIPIVVLALLSVPYIINRSLPFWRPLFLAVRFIPYNLWLWIFGNVKQRERLKDVHLVTKFLQESTLFARLVDLRPGVTAKYFIVFSHIPSKDDNSTNDHIGHGDRYRIPGFPLDEAECIFRLWYLAASSLHLSWTDIQAQCSCTSTQPVDRDHILGGSLAIVGSPKRNTYAADLMEELKRSEGNRITRQVRFYMEMEQQTDTCYLNADNKFGNKLMPDSTSNRKTGEQLKDYALLMKLPNLLAGTSQKGSTLLLLAGCKVAGQVALTDWISEPSNMGDLVSTYGTDPFQIAFEIKYKFVEKKDGLPIILETRELYREKISVQPQAASTAAASK